MPGLHVARHSALCHKHRPVSTTAVYMHAKSIFRDKNNIYQCIYALIDTHEHRQGLDNAAERGEERRLFTSGLFSQWASLTTGVETLGSYVPS